MTLHPDFADQPESVRNTLLDNIAKLEKFAEWHRFPARAPALADRVNMGMTSIESATKIAAGWAEHIAALQGDPTNNVTPLDGSRRSNASAMADLIRQAQGTMDDIREVVRQIGGDSALVYDLSTPTAWSMSPPATFIRSMVACMATPRCSSLPRPCVTPTPSGCRVATGLVTISAQRGAG